MSQFALLLAAAFAGAALATSVHVLPERMDLTFVLTIQSFGVMVALALAALRGADRERLGAAALSGATWGGVLGLVVFLIVLGTSVAF